MKLLLSIAAPALFFGSVCCSAAAAAAADVACVWQVKSETNTIYLAGAIPFLREADLPLPVQYKKAFDASEQVVFEVDPKESKDEAAAQKMIKQGMFLDGGSLEDAVSKETYKALGEFLSSSGAQPAGMDRFRPWFAAVMIGMTEIMKLGSRPDLGVSDTIEGWALEAGKPISGLEGIEVELDLLKGLGKEAHEHMLKSTLEDVADVEKMEKEMGEFIGAWRAGDVAKIDRLEREGETELDRKVNQKMTRGRSAAWMKNFEKALQGDDPTLFVLGLGHFVGKGNLRDRLEAKGFTVEQLRAPAKKKKKKNKNKKKNKKPALIPVSLH